MRGRHVGSTVLGWLLVLGAGCAAHVEEDGTEASRGETPEAPVEETGAVAMTKGGKATGRMNTRQALDGFAVIYDYEQERNGAITYAGHAVYTFDPKESCYVLHWFDSMGSPPEVFKGTFTGDVLTLAHGGPGMHARMTHDFSKEKRMVSRMEMSPDGKAWKTLFDGTYEKK